MTNWPTIRPHVPRGFREFFMRMHRRNGLKFVMLMYPDHLQSWLVFGHGLLIFLVMVPLLQVKLVKIFGVRSFYWERMGDLNGLKFGMLVYIDHLQNWLDFGYVLLIFPILVPLWLNETLVIKLVEFGVFEHFWRMHGSECRGRTEAYFRRFVLSFI